MDKSCPYKSTGCYSFCARYDRVHNQCVDLTIADALTLLADQVYELDDSPVKEKPSSRMLNRYRMDMEAKAAKKYPPDGESN